MNMTLELLMQSLNRKIVDCSISKVLAFTATARFEIFEKVADKDFYMKGEIKVQGQNNLATANRGENFTTYNEVKKTVMNVLFVIALLCNCKIN
jgi:hypothetical protein